MRRVATPVQVLCMIAPLLIPATALAEPFELVREGDFDARSGRLGLELESAGYARLWDAGRGVISDFPLPDGRRVDLELEPLSLIAPDAVFVSVDETGEHQRPAPRMRFYKGTVATRSDSLVVMALDGQRISGSIRLGYERFGFGPPSASLSATDALRIEIWPASAEQGSGTCAGTKVAHADQSSIALDEEYPGPFAAPVSPDGGAQLLLDLALDSTTEWCAHFGNDASAAEAYLLSLWSQVSAIYDTEILELIQVVFLRTHCGAADPYTDGLTALADRSALLAEFEAEWIANMGGVDRATAHLFQLSTDGNVGGGLANTYTCSGQSCSSVLCLDNAAYAVNTFPASGGSPASFEVRIAAHELGHNHASPHTNCLQDSMGNWLSECFVESCGSNPWCDATGCFPGPADTNNTGTIMNTACDFDLLEFEDEAVEPILRGEAEAASCIAFAGLPGEVREQTGDGVRIAKPNACPDELLRNDDGFLNSAWKTCDGCQYAWIKRYTPGCHPFRLTRVDGVIANVSVGRPIRVVVYHDAASTGDPTNASLVYSEDVTVQVSSGNQFSQYTLASPVTILSGDLYIGFYDLQIDVPSPFIAALDTSSIGDSYRASNTTAPTSYVPKTDGTWMIRGFGGAVPAGSIALSWGSPCNDATVPGQDYSVYQGDIGVFDSYSSLSCATNGVQSYLAQSPPDDTFFLVVPFTTASEGSYGRDSDGTERPPSAAPCKTQAFESCQ